MQIKEFEINDLFKDKTIKNIATVLGIGASLVTIISFLLPKPQPQIVNNYYCECNSSTSDDFNRIIIA
jgi:hypothetical protein